MQATIGLMPINFPQTRQHPQQLMDELMMETLLTEDEYRQALKRFLEICDTDDNTPEADELEQLMTVMEIYEQENCP